MKNLRLLIKSNGEKQMAQFGLGCKFHDLQNFSLKFFLSNAPWMQYEVEGIIKVNSKNK